VLTRTQKEEQVAELQQKFRRATSVFVAEYRGLDVQKLSGLRRKLRSEAGHPYEYRVTKNTLLRRAAEGTEIAAAIPHFRGPTAVAISYGDPVRLAKILIEYAKEHEIFKLRGAVLDGRVLGKGEIGTLATLPSLEELRGQLVGLLQAPASKLVRVLVAPGTQVARVVAARQKQLEEGLVDG